MIFKQAKQFDDHVVHRDKTDQLDILDIAEKFIGENSRRKHFLVVSYSALLVMY